MLQEGLQTDNAAASVTSAEAQAAESRLKHAMRLHVKREAEGARRLRRANARVIAQRARNAAVTKARLSAGWILLKSSDAESLSWGGVCGIP